MENLKVYLEKNEYNYQPISGTAGSAGYDIVAAENKIIMPGQTVLVSSKLKMAIPDGYEIQIRPRSGLSLKTALRIPNSPGTIDSDYRDEIKVICHNSNSFDSWAEDLLREPQLMETLKKFKKVSYLDFYKNFYTEAIDEFFAQTLAAKTMLLNKNNIPYGSIEIKAGERFAQMVFASYHKANFELVEDITEYGENRGGGFGSTGKR